MMAGMVASVGRISAGVGYDYLTKEVATSKHDYYTGQGEAPGVWTGRGISALGLSGEVSAEDMAHLYGRFVDPRSAGSDHEVVIGRRVSTRTIHKGTAREKELVPVAAFDVTFSPSKSVSALFAATSDERIRSEVIEAHEAAVAAGIEYLEDHAGHARAGVGGVRRVDTDGFIVAQFRHRTARSTQPGVRVGDPQLHSHCAILNRLHCTDGNWRTLDGTAIYRHTHAAGAFYGAVLERELTARLGVEWVAPEAGERLAMREIAGIPTSVRKQWSSRREQIDATTDRILKKHWETEHRSPTRSEMAQMRSEATVRSRKPKSGGVVDLHGQWRADLDDSEIAAIDAVTNQVAPDAVTGARLTAGSEELQVAGLQALETQRSWWNRAHLYAEVSRLIDTPSREAIELEVERIVGSCVVLEHDDDPDYAQLDAAKMTSPRIIAAENAVLDDARSAAPFTIPAEPDPILGDDQIEAVEALTEGNHQVTTVIGPAGAGKTTLLQSVADSYRAAGREIGVFALAANAAQVVTEETGIDATTIATWRVGGADLPRNGLLLIDEASMVPTLTLRDLCRTAKLYNTRVGLVGDYAQMGSPEAGGLLRDLGALESATMMTTVRRFSEPWEANASKRLRRRDGEVAELYADRERIHPCEADDAVERVADAWFADYQAGKETLVVTDTTSDAADVSAACQQRLLDVDRLGDAVGVAADSNQLHVGDLIQTRDNTIELYTTNRRKVLNREVWRITGTNPAGSVVAQNVRSDTRVAITPRYLSRAVVLAYGTTLAGAQGRTCDSGHVLVTPRTTAASLYVGMSRGRIDNHATVVTTGHDHEEFELGHREPTGAFADAINRNPDGELSATTVEQRWQQAQPDRAERRDNDRMLQYATSIWTNYYRPLPPAIRNAITVTTEEVAARLVTISNGQWNTIIERALAGTDWTQPDATDRFMAQLHELPADTSFDPTTHQPGTHHTRER